jgi:hypothetical protein
MRGRITQTEATCVCVSMGGLIGHAHAPLLVFLFGSSPCALDDSKSPPPPQSHTHPARTQHSRLSVWPTPPTHPHSTLLQALLCANLNAHRQCFGFDLPPALPCRVCLGVEERVTRNEGVTLALGAQTKQPHHRTQRHGAQRRADPATTASVQPPDQALRCT